MSSKAIIRFSALLAAGSWIGMLLTALSILFSKTSGLEQSVGDEAPPILMSLFIFALFTFYKYRIERAESINFVDLLWKVFVTGLIATIVSLFFQLVMNMLGNTKLAENVVFLDFIYLSNFGLVAAFLISTFIVWKRLILYQKSRFLLTAWKIFEYALLVGLVMNALPVTIVENFEDVYLIILILVGLVLSVNMKWVAYLNFKQKWKSILLIALAMFYLGYFSFTLVSASSEIADKTDAFLDIRENIFIIALVSFIFIYALFSLLVLLFNLPTSSVFEQKLEEVVSFQKLSQSIQTEQNEERVYEILIESSVNTVFADAAWIEVDNEKDGPKYYTHKIDVEGIIKIKNHLKANKIKGILDQGSDKTKNLNKYLATLRGSPYRSMMAFPIKVKGKQEATIALLKDVSEGFNKENSKIISTFSNQAGISIENFRLLTEALQNERYKEELKIAKNVQSSLLPDEIVQDDDYSAAAFSEAADEVGGDYYDTFRINDHKVAMIISDVSGKGTSAAFHMSQMKGVFYSLTQHDMSPKDFLDSANNALSRCLDKASFITTSYYVFDTKKKQVEFSRAGHCPTLYYSKAEGKATYFQNKGLGLGILRNEGFKNYIQIDTFMYSPGDILVLYTDGITEAKNVKGEEYGYDLLREAIQKHSDAPVEEIKKEIISELYAFTGTEAIDDDYTVLIVKFN